jgi:putative serine protease PepD
MKRNRQHVWMIGGATVIAVALSLAAVIVLRSTTAPSDAPTTSQVVPTAGFADGLERTYVAAIRTVGSSVVQIETPLGLGSGVVLDRGGHIVTNNHVVGSYTRFVVTDSTGQRYRASLVGRNPQHDLAVIHAEHGGDLRAAVLGDSSQLNVGDLVLAVGNPLGLQSSVTNGIVSALGRTINEPRGVVLPNLIQTSAAINPGNSGGALIDLSGHVVGIPTLAAIDPENMQQANGIGFAIPSDTVRQVASQLISDTQARPVADGRSTDSRRSQSRMRQS